MARNRNSDRRRGTGPEQGGSVPAEEPLLPESGSPASPVALPPAWVGYVLSSLLVLHAALIVLSYLAVVRPSSIQARAVAAFGPYLAALHLAPEPNMAETATVDGASFFLARGDGAERVHRLQFATAGDPGEGDWQNADLSTWSARGGSERRRRFQRYLTAVASLGATDQNTLAARLTVPLVAGRSDVRMVRVVRLPNVMTNVVQETEPAPYTARVLRQGNELRLVRVPAPRLGSAVRRD